MSSSDEKLLPLVEIVLRVPGRASYATVWGWCVRGVDGTRMESKRIGGRIYSSVGALRRFMEAMDARFAVAVRAESAVSPAA